MTSEIPDSVMKIAGGVVADIFHDIEIMHMDRIEEAARPIAEAIMAERERCAKFGDAWDNPSALRLTAGEMTAQEMRTARAVARGIAAAIRQQATP